MHTYLATTCNAYPIDILIVQSGFIAKEKNFHQKCRWVKVFSKKSENCGYWIFFNDFVVMRYYIYAETNLKNMHLSGKQYLYKQFFILSAVFLDILVSIEKLKLN